MRLRFQCNKQAFITLRVHSHRGHPAGGAFTSDFSANSSIMVVCENLFLKFNQNCLSKARPKNATSIKLFSCQSEVNVLPAGCEGKGKLGVNGFEGNIHISKRLKMNVNIY